MSYPLRTSLSDGDSGALGDFETAWAKLNRAWIDVKTDFGAVGDGSTDDTAAIQAALDAVVSTGNTPGGTVYFPPGRFRVTSALTSSTGNLRLLGAGGPGEQSSDGVGTSVVYVDGAAWGLRFGVGSSSVIFQGPTIERLNFQDKNGTALGGVQIGNVSNFRLRDFTCSDFAVGKGVQVVGGVGSQYGEILGLNGMMCQIGLDLVDTNGCRVFGGLFQHYASGAPVVPAGTTGIRLQSGSETTRVYGTVLQFLETCIDVGSDNAELHGCRFEAFTTGMKTAGRGTMLLGGTFHNDIVGSGGTAIAVTSAATLSFLLPSDIASVSTDIDDSGTQTFAYYPSNRFMRWGQTTAVNGEAHTFDSGSGAPADAVGFFRGVATNGSGVRANFGLKDGSGAVVPYGAIVSSIESNSTGAHAGDMQLLSADAAALVLRARLRNDANTADGETCLLVRRNVGGSYTLQRVSMGAADSGGSGYKVLRVPN